MFRAPPAATRLTVCSLLLVACGGTQGGEGAAELPAICGELTAEGSGVPNESSGVPNEILWVQSHPVLIRGGVVMTAAGDVFEPGFVYFEHGRIVAVGDGDGAAFEGAEVEVIDATGRWVTPGIIDTHSHLGVYPSPGVAAHSDGNEATSPMTPQVRAMDSVWPQDPGFERAVAGGITAMQILPGSANLIGGEGFTMKPHRGALHAAQLAIAGAPHTLKMACGENPRRVYGERGQMPSTRMGSIALVRQAFIDARAYAEQHERFREQLATWCEDGAPSESRPTAPGINLGSETLASVLRGETLPEIHCYQADDMLAQIALADEFGYQIRGFHHAIEAYKIADVLAERNISVSTWADWWGFKMEAFDAVMENAALVHAAGGIAVIHSDSPIGIQRLNQEAAKVYYAALDAGLGLDDNDVLRWITYNAAWTLGIEDLTGTLEVGKMADLVVWSDHPFSVYARPERVFIDGMAELAPADATTPWSDFELGLWPREVTP